MNRKFFNGLLLLALATGGVGTFTSCTDHEQDFQNKYLKGQEDLSDQIAAIRNFLGQPFEGSSLNERIQALIDAGEFAKAEDLIALEARVDAIEAKLPNFATKEELETVKNDILDKFNNYYTKEEIEALIGPIDKTANDALTLAKLNKETIANLDTRLSTLEGLFPDLEKRVEALETEYADLLERLDSDEVAIDQIREDLDNFIKEVEDMYNRIMKKFANLVTGIEVNQVHNAIFGTFNFPVGINSNMITNYYALSDHNAVFPPKSTEFEYYSSNPAWVGVDLTKIDAPSMTILTADVPVLEKLADVYLTINPANRDFSGLELSLVNSQDEVVPVLDELVPEKTDKVLTMGISRAADNGFYVAEAKPRTTWAAEDINGIKYEIEDGLLAAFKDAIKNRTKSDFAELAKLILKQFGKDIPAYAVKCEWDDTQLDEDGTEVSVKNSVRSDYELSVTTFRPLSYRSGWGFSVDAQLPTPTFGYIRDAIDRAFDSLRSRLTLNLGINTPEIAIDLKDCKVVVGDMNITVNLAGAEVYGLNADGSVNYNDRKGVVAGDDAKVTLSYKSSGKVDEPGTGELKDVAMAIQNAINGMLDGEADDSLTAQINKQLDKQIGDMVKDINDQLANVQAKINNTVDAIENRINAELNGKFGRLSEDVLNLYNALADKINNVLKDPNAYLQVMAAYMGNDGLLHHLSTTAADATPLSVSNSLEMFVTSYNAEIIVPSFKKYVAIVDATDASGNWGDYETAKAANTGYLNTILPGNQQRVYIDGSKLKAGRTYKVLYSSLDYRGFTSTKVYYVRAN